MDHDRKWIDEINLHIWRLLQETSRVGMRIPHEAGLAMRHNLERIAQRVITYTDPPATPTLPPGGLVPPEDLPGFGASEVE